jgi:hypothetical protein
MIRNILLAAAFTGLTAVSALASGPRVIDEAGSPTIVYDEPSANVVGSADAFVTGGPHATNYETRRVFRTQAPGLARDPSQIVVDSSN